MTPPQQIFSAQERRKSGRRAGTRVRDLGGPMLDSYPDSRVPSGSTLPTETPAPLQAAQDRSKCCVSMHRSSATGSPGFLRLRRLASLRQPRISKTLMQYRHRKILPAASEPMEK